MVRLPAACLHMEPQTACLGQAPEDVRRETRVALELHLGRRPAAEIDRRARQRVVHRYDRVAVAGDAAPVAQGVVERLAERERRVLGRVVGTGLEVADTFEDEIEAAVERKLLEEVVVDSGSGRDVAKNS